MSNLEYHVLLALAGGPLHGYAVKQRVEDESAGSLTPQPGSLYRVIARLMIAGLVAETDPKGPAVPHPGLSRRYYALTAAGRRALAAEAGRLKGAAALAEKRLRTARS
jgi:DNA-binding PadR family transcriptional regulator